MFMSIQYHFALTSRDIGSEGSSSYVRIFRAGRVLTVFSVFSCSDFYLGFNICKVGLILPLSIVSSPSSFRICPRYLPRENHQNEPTGQNLPKLFILMSSPWIFLRSFTQPGVSASFSMSSMMSASCLFRILSIFLGRYVEWALELSTLLPSRSLQGEMLSVLSLRARGVPGWLCFLAVVPRNSLRSADSSQNYCLYQFLYLSLCSEGVIFFLAMMDSSSDYAVIILMGQATQKDGLSVVIFSFLRLSSYFKVVFLIYFLTVLVTILDFHGSSVEGLAANFGCIWLGCAQFCITLQRIYSLLPFLATAGDSNVFCLVGSGDWRGRGRSARQRRSGLAHPAQLPI